LSAEGKVPSAAFCGKINKEKGKENLYLYPWLYCILRLILVKYFGTKDL